MPSTFRRKRSNLKLPIWTSVVLGVLNISLMMLLIISLAIENAWLPLVLGAIALGISLFGITFYSFLTIKEIQLNRRQSNFVDSVTHELKTPIAALRLYLDTLLLRELKPDDRQEFYQTMNVELERLDQLINQLLEVGRLESIGSQTDPEYVPLEKVLKAAATQACRHHQVDFHQVFTLEIEDLALHSRRILLDMIFGNLMDNAVKYGGTPPKVVVTAKALGRDRVLVQIRDHGKGIPQELRNQVFQLFFRANDELRRTRKGTGLGLHIVKTMVGIMKGRIAITDGPNNIGSVFEVTLPGRVNRKRDEHLNQSQQATEPDSVIATDRESISTAETNHAIAKTLPTESETES